MFMNRFLCFNVVLLFGFHCCSTLNAKVASNEFQDSINYRNEHRMQDKLDHKLLMQNINSTKDTVRDFFPQIDGLLLAASGQNLTSFIEIVLKSQGSSIDEAYKILSTVRNPVELISTINNALKYNILKIDDNLVKLDSFQLISFIRSFIRSILRYFLQDNYLLQFVIQNEINNKINLHYQDWKEQIDKETVPLKVLEDFLSNDKLNHRITRNVGETTGIIQSLIDILLTTLRINLSELARTVQNTIHQVLTNITNFLLSFYATSQPEGFIANFISRLGNVLIQQSMQVINNIEQILDSFLNEFIEIQNKYHRTRRDSLSNALLGNGTSDTSNTNNPSSIIQILILPFKLVINIISVVFRSVISIITHPIQTGSTVFNMIVSIIRLIFSTILSISGKFVYNILQPLNCILKQAVVNVLDALESWLLPLIVKPVKQYIFDLINRIIPCTTECNLKLSQLMLD